MVYNVDKGYTYGLVNEDNGDIIYLMGIELEL